MADADEIKAAEKRGYSNGYNAGRRRVESDDERKAERERERQRFDAYYCAALTGLIQNAGWRTNDEPWKTMDDYVQGAHNFAKKSLAKNRHQP